MSTDDQLNETGSIGQKRPRSDSATDQVQEAKKIKQSSNSQNVVEMLKNVIKKSEIGKTKKQLFEIMHECKCWIIIRLQHGWSMLLFRKGSSSEHEKHCQAAVRTGNKFFKITNCNGSQLTVGDPKSSLSRWYKTFGAQQCDSFPQLDSKIAEYFQSSWYSNKLIPKLSEKTVIMGLNGHQISPIDSVADDKENKDLSYFKPFSGCKVKKNKNRLDLAVEITDLSDFNQLDENSLYNRYNRVLGRPPYT